MHGPATKQKGINLSDAAAAVSQGMKANDDSCAPEGR